MLLPRPSHLLEFRVFFFFLRSSHFDTTFPGTRAAGQTKICTQQRIKPNHVISMATAADTLISFLRNGIDPTFCGKRSFQSRALNHHSLGLDTWKTQEQKTGHLVVVEEGGSQHIQIKLNRMSCFRWDTFYLNIISFWLRVHLKKYC